MINTFLNSLLGFPPSPPNDVNFDEKFTFDIATKDEPYVPPCEDTTSQPKTRGGELYHNKQAPLSLHVIIVGCGLGGLAAAHCLARSGHKITILEASSEIGEVGAGIQVSPNISRLLIRWGLGPQLEKLAVIPEGIQFLRYCTGERIGYTTWGESIEREFSAPYYHIHRADLRKLMYDITVPLENVELRLNSAVVGIEPGETNLFTDPKPSVTLRGGEIIPGDLIIGADGIKSLVQTIVLGGKTPPKPTGDAAYRAVVPTSVLLDDPELRPLVEHPMMTAWMAPKRHIMGYNIRAKQEYNLVLLHPDDESVESWTAEGNADKMRDDFSDFEPRVRRLLSHVQSTMKWRLMDRNPLPTWMHLAGRIVLLGDACHPMLPYRAQGAAMAIEDAAVLGNLFSRVSSRVEIKPLLEAYQSLRLPRTAATQTSSTLNQKIFHLSDGNEQRARDMAMRQAMEADSRQEGGVICGHNGNPNQWADKSRNIIQFGYDAEAVAEEWWHYEGELMKERL